MESEPPPPRHRRAVRFGLLAILATLGIGAIWAIRTYPPSDSPYLPRCQLHAATGLHCAGCGLTRSLHSLLNADVSQAMAWHPLSPVLIPLLVVLVGRSLWQWATGVKAKPTRGGSPRWVWLLIAFVVLFSVARNLPYYPFTLIAPHELTSR